ncbi:MAG: dTDP-4-dehydrorhamnose reductase [Gammaproteobacteria bacterium]|nr:MAG: dTDP-4-dehydrorhamnose reductase [Gammaproteobacteria bacterium]RTZ72109.1 MAG: dTDP-4-dehydrorhamnose reductase [Gammaproteobacteria bacterium]
MNEEGRPTILLLGPGGQVGWELRRTLSTLGSLRTAGREGADHSLDLTRPGALAGLIRSRSPDLVVNAAAYTAVDQAESEPELARRINAEAVGELGRAALEAGCPVVHYSTDYVFSGEGERPWREEDATGPVSVYGHSKQEGERKLADSGADHLILRLAWVYGGRGKNFLLTMRRLMGERSGLSVVSDQFGSPTWSRHIAEATAQVLAQCRTGQGFAFGERQGIYHLTAGGQASWHEFACAIADRLGTKCEVSAITTADYPTPARRPAWSVLDNEKLQRTFSVALPHWRIGLDLCMEELEACDGAER